MKKPLIAAAALAIAGAGGAWWFAGQQGGAPASAPMSASAQEATASSQASLVPDMVLGEQSAPLTVIEYASFTCPHCANFHATVFDQLKANYIDTGKVKFVYREVYFDKFGLWAALVARCDGPKKYFGVADLLFDGQKGWLASGEEQGIADALRKIGVAAGMTAEQVDACLNDQDKAKAMVAAYQTNATNDKIEGTPTFIIDGESHSGEMAYDEFAKILDAKLAK
jgi:protein-disulfide isomerase